MSRCKLLDQAVRATVIVGAFALAGCATSTKPDILYQTHDVSIEKTVPCPIDSVKQTPKFVAPADEIDINTKALLKHDAAQGTEIEQLRSAIGACNEKVKP